MVFYVYRCQANNSKNKKKNIRLITLRKKNGNLNRKLGYY